VKISMPELNAWENFYIVIGGAAGALIGLQFVVLTLTADRPSLRSEEGGAAFSTPTVVHFCTALFIAALLSVPWRTAHVPRLVLGVIGAAGLGYGILIVRHMLIQRAYKPVLIDWVSNVAAPVFSYGLFLVAAITAEAHSHEAYIGIAGASLLLLFIGIYNSWDAITYHALSGRSAKRKRK
jgi:hypothetical protein